ncbi:MAG: PD-(D/E)XK nuclease family protein [Pseudomonadota bacterium]
MNGFQMYGLDHLSPSSLNKFIDAPDAWVAEKLFKKKGAAGAAMWRGIVVEDAIAAVLEGKLDRETATKEAVADYDKKIAGLLNVKPKERDGIPGMIEQGLMALEDYPEPILAENSRGQHKVSLKCNLDDGTSIDFIGYLDFAFGGNRKQIVDLKTTHACPSKMSFSHRVQQTVYDLAAADGFEVRFLYVTPKKSGLLGEEEFAGQRDEIIATIKANANRLNNLLKAGGGDPEKVANLVPVNPDSFYWSGAHEHRRAVFGV